jgi:hypothetical protein
MGGHHSVPFITIRSEGALLPADFLQRVAKYDSDLAGLTRTAYHYDEELSEVVNNSWHSLLATWTQFKAALTDNPVYDKTGTNRRWERWLQKIFYELKYGQLNRAQTSEIDGKRYTISHQWNYTPIHLVDFKVKLDERREQVSGKTGVIRYSPYKLVQDWVNFAGKHPWGIVSNGLSLRLLRKNMYMTRQAYLEFDLEAMMQGEVYTDFVLFWLICHQSRLEGDRPEECWLEKWSRSAQQEGVRLYTQQSSHVERAITALGRGFINCHQNQSLHEKLRTGVLSNQDYYRQLLRLVYRLIVLFVAEDREVLFQPNASEQARERYSKYYSTARLRHLADNNTGTSHVDLFRGIRLIMDLLGQPAGCPELGLSALNGFLYSKEAIPDLATCDITNNEFLDIIRELAFTTDKKNIRQRVNYKHIGSEELGNIYERLLELHPVLNIEAKTFELQEVKGNERKTSGTYYTPPSLVHCLLDSALEPIIQEACTKPNVEQALLDLKICDPACGSGHFLVAAAHRIAARLAIVRAKAEEPTPQEQREALRDIVSNCIYGVDINPMAVELCKVSLWMESIEPGKPLSFLDHHILCGDSLIGATPALLRKGIPNEAFEPIEGDNKKICSEYKQKNKGQLTGQLSLFDPTGKLWESQSNLATSIVKMDKIHDDTVQDYYRKQSRYTQFRQSDDYLFGQSLGDAWCASFVWKKNKEFAYPITYEIFRKIEHNPSDIAPWMTEEIIRLRKQYKFFHWYLEFPGVFHVPANSEEAENEQAGWSGGFDVVLGNVPWEKIKIQEKEWFANRRPDIANTANAAQRHKMIAALMGEDPELYKVFMDDQRQATGESHFVRNSDRYPLCGRGDVNTYTVFAETMRSIIRSRGRVGCIVPSGIATDDTTKLFFRDLMETQSLTSLYSFENEEFLFRDIHHSTKFCLLTISGNANHHKAADFVFFARRTSNLEDEDRHFSLSASDVALLNPNTHTCPIFRSKHDMLLTKKIYERVPVFIKDGPPEINPWSIKFSRMFDMANDSHLFLTREQLKREGWKLEGNIFCKDGRVCLPLYEGKMTWHFDHRFGTYEGQTQAQANQKKLPESSLPQHTDPLFLVMPKYWIHESHFPNLIKDGRSGLLVFRDVTSAVVLRTAIFSIIPIVACGDTLHAVVYDNKDTRRLMYLASNGASFVFDYVTRQKLGGSHLKYFTVKQLPMLPPTQYSISCQWESNTTLGNWIYPRALELIYTAWDLEPFAKDCGHDGPPFRWDEERRFLLRCELDAAYFHLYGIERDDVGYIMETFPIVKRNDEKYYETYRTKQTILAIYDAMGIAIRTGRAYRTLLAPPPADPSVAHPTRS